MWSQQYYFVLLILLLQLPHVAVIFFPESCFTVLDTSGINIVIAHVATSSPTKEFCAVTFPTITLTNFPIEAILYQPITVTTGLALHPHDRFRHRAEDKGGDEQKNCRYGREQSLLIHVSPSGRLGSVVDAGGR
jgi:hypothetical protein